MIARLLVATHNRGKIAEYAEMMADLELDWLGLDEVGIEKDVEETGKSFRENAVLKAQAYAAETGLLTLADDSGLEVDVLGGQPGVYTARYGGSGLTHVERYQLLLQNLLDVAWENRTARFKAVIALAASNGALIGTAEGVCKGLIALEPAGEGGFGYDPVFFLPERGKTMAQLDSTVKHQISHRGRALKAISPSLRRALG